MIYIEEKDGLFYKYLVKAREEDKLLLSIDEDIERRKCAFRKALDFDNAFKELCEIKKLYDRKEAIAKRFGPIGFVGRFDEFMKYFDFEKVDEISKEDYFKGKKVLALSETQYLKIDGDSYYKFEVTFDRQKMEEILANLDENTGFMDSEYFVTKTNLEQILRGVLNGKEYISALIQYDSKKEEINIFRRGCLERFKQLGIADKLTISNGNIDETIKLLTDAKKEFPNSKYNMNVGLPQDYYDEILNELRFELIETGPKEIVTRIIEFDNNVSEEEISKLVLKK